jgi:tetratricopeptide (TPR) repeat protein
MLEILQQNPTAMASQEPNAALRKTLAAAALLCVTFLAYFPAIRGTPIWDDNAHITRPELQSLDGLRRIWFKVGATQQYYPLLHSAFWLEHKFWDDATIGYHILNILLHATSAFLVALILWRLEIPGAFLAAAIFALHPVHVESVAWITEQKNTLSAVFYLGAMLAYLRWEGSGFGSTGFTAGRVQGSGEERGPSWFWYAVASALFLAGLLSKTVTATLPAALMVILWWERGRISWKRDLLPLIPWFVLGAAAGMLTARVERKLIGAEGPGFDLHFTQRILLAGRVFWFYLAKLLWPSNLIFIYPRWDISRSGTWWWGTAAAMALVAALWAVRRRWRGPLAAVLFFAGSLFPALGFFNVYPFLFSFVADHFQHLASLGIIALVSAFIAIALDRAPFLPRMIGFSSCAILLIVLGALTWRQSHIYLDRRTLWEITLRKNPGCWIGHNELGNVLQAADYPTEAEAHYREALRLRPDYAEAHNNLGMLLVNAGHVDEAIGHFNEALRLAPNLPFAHCNLGSTLLAVGKPTEAIPHFQRALELRPNYLEAQVSFGSALLSTGRTDQAIEHFQQAVRIDPDSAGAHIALGTALTSAGRANEAILQHEEALRLKPGSPEAHNGLGVALSQAGRLPEAIEHYQAALRARPDYFEAHTNLAFALKSLGRYQESIDHYQQAVRLAPDLPEPHYNLAIAFTQAGQTQQAIAEYERTLHIRPDYVEALYNLGSVLTSAGRPHDAIEQLEKALRLRSNDPEIHNNLGLALANLGRTSEAVAHLHEALRLKPDHAIACVNLGVTLANAGRMPEAIASFERAVRLAPNLPDAAMNLARAYADVGRSADAITTAENAIHQARLNGQTAVANQIEAWLSNYRSKNTGRAR